MVVTMLENCRLPTQYECGIRRYRPEHDPPTPAARATYRAISASDVRHPFRPIAFIVRGASSLVVSGHQLLSERLLQFACRGVVGPFRSLHRALFLRSAEWGGPGGRHSHCPEGRRRVHGGRVILVTAECAAG